MLLTALVALAAFPQSIDYECKATRLSVVLKDLSKTLHTELTATPELGERFEVISVHGVSPEGFRAQLAKTNCAKWVAHPAGDRLTPDVDAEKAERAKLLSSRIEELRQAQAKIAADVAKMGAFGNAEAVALLGRMTQVDQSYDAEASGGPGGMDAEKACDNAPGQRAAKRIALLLSPDEIATLHGRVAFSDRPTSLQRPLSPKVREVISQLATEQAAWTKVYTGDPKFDARQSWMSVDPRGNKEPVVAETTRCFLKFKADDNQPYIEVYFVDPKDRVLSFGFVRLDGPPPKTTNAAAASDPTTMTMPEEAKAFVQGLGQRTFVTPVEVGPEWRRVFLHPDKFEPLSYAPSDALLAAIHARKENLVAWIGDEAVDLGRFGWTAKDQPANVARFWGLLRYCGLRTETSGTWRLVLPEDHGAPIDRGALATLLATLDTTGGLRLAGAANFAAAVGGESEPGIAYAYEEAILPGSHALNRALWSDLRFYGSLTEAQRQLLADQKLLALKDVSGEARQILVDRLLNGGYANLRRIDANGRQIYGSGFNIQNEPTEILGSGFDPTAVFGIHTNRHRGVAAFANDRYSQKLRPTPMGIRSLAMQILRPSIPQLNQYDQLNGGEAKSYIPGFISDLSFEFMLQPNLRYTMQLSDNEFDLRQKRLALADLPEDYTGELQKTTEEVRKQYGEGGGGLASIASGAP